MTHQHLDSAIRTVDLTKRFGTKTAVNQLNLSIDRGEIFGLIGPNGAGKSTTMRLLVDVLRPTSGEAFLLGKNPRTAGKELRGNLGYLPDEFITTPSFTGTQILKHFMTLNPPKDSSRLEELQQRLGADLSRPLGKLSKGNKQKIGLMQAFVHDPEILILDEPTSGLDPIVQQTFLELVQEAGARGQTVVLSSHILSEIQHAAQRVGVMKDGQLITTSSVQQIRDDAGQQLHARVQLSTPWGEKNASVAEFGEELKRRLPCSSLSVIEEGETVQVSGMIKDPVNELLAVFQHVEVLGFSLEKPDLEETVLHLYRDDSTSKADGTRTLSEERER